MKNLSIILLSILFVSCASTTKVTILELKDGRTLEGFAKRHSHPNWKDPNVLFYYNQGTTYERIRYDNILQASIKTTINDEIVSSDKIYDFSKIPLNIGYTEASKSTFVAQDGNRPLSVGEYKKPNTGSDDAAKILFDYVMDVAEGMQPPSSSSLSFGYGQPKGCHVFGKIKFVQFGGDYKVRMVGAAPNLKVKYVSYGASTQGNWQIVDYGEDYKIELVQAGEDFSVQIVDFGQGCN